MKINKDEADLQKDLVEINKQKKDKLNKITEKMNLNL